jgi:hypothetical protein
MPNSGIVHVKKTDDSMLGRDNRRSVGPLISVSATHFAVGLIIIRKSLSQRFLQTFSAISKLDFPEKVTSVPVRRKGRWQKKDTWSNVVRMGFLIAESPMTVRV